MRRWLALFALLPVFVAPAAAQEFAPHRASYTVNSLEKGKPGSGMRGTYAYELKLTCDGHVVNQRLRLETTGPRSLTSEQQSQMFESKDGKKLTFEHRSVTGGAQVSLVRGEALLGNDGSGQARFSEPAGQIVSLPAGTLYPIAIARFTIRAATLGEGAFERRFFFGEKVKPPQIVKLVIDKAPRRLDDVKIPDGASALVDGRARLYYRAAFFDAETKGQGEPAYRMSSLTLDNGIELYGTHEEADSGIEYRITRLETLPRPECR